MSFGVIACEGGDEDNSGDGAWYSDINPGESDSGTIEVKDEKIYRVYFESAGYYKFTLTNMSTDCDFSLIAYDANDKSTADLGNNEEYESASESGAEVNEVMTVNVTSPGYAFIWIGEADGFAGEYTLNVSKKRSSFFETLLVGGSVTGTSVKASDINVYRVNFISTGSRTFNLTGQSKDADMVLSYKADGTSMAASEILANKHVVSETFSTADESLTFTGSGYVYVLVAAHFESADYTLSVE
ncbi:MAG: hypothetical protein ACRCUT_11465 [Spirochaetota bacterium]